MADRHPLKEGYGNMRADQLWLCGFRPGPSGIPCYVDAIWHGINVTGDDGELCGMFACAVHEETLRAFSDYAHVLDSPCGLPDSLFKFPENFCYVPFRCRCAVRGVNSRHVIGVSAVS